MYLLLVFALTFTLSAQQGGMLGLGGGGGGGMMGGMMGGGGGGANPGGMMGGGGGGANPNTFYIWAMKEFIYIKLKMAMMMWLEKSREL
ncbi:putative uncharacterized protein DDB_G0287183 isoform X5 [Pantherophis guttatus]|uniref:Uncharacterized protein n=1 Tax=Pantherophis guttatus TaxID=94885 RepID=A0ABM3ZNJ7_PANGU|nr:putative uncharacterized protein DDB_G0287183 isoform X5 [Pantherophis guttatus]